MVFVPTAINLTPGGGAQKWAIPTLFFGTAIVTVPPGGETWVMVNTGRDNAGAVQIGAPIWCARSDFAVVEAWTSNNANEIHSLPCLPGITFPLKSGEVWTLQSGAAAAVIMVALFFRHGFL